jgi:hypothetical protein
MMTEVAGGDSRMNSYSKLFVADDQLNEQSVKDDESVLLWLAKNYLRESVNLEEMTTQHIDMNRDGRGKISTRKSNVVKQRLKKAIARLVENDMIDQEADDLSLGPQGEIWTDKSIEEDPDHRIGIIV